MVINPKLFEHFSSVCILSGSCQCYGYHIPNSNRLSSAGPTIYQVLYETIPRIQEFQIRTTSKASYGNYKDYLGLYTYCSHQFYLDKRTSMGINTKPSRRKGNTADRHTSQDKPDIDIEDELRQTQSGAYRGRQTGIQRHL